MLPEAGATELIFIAAVALIVVGPKDLPALLRKVGQFTAKMRGLAAEFRSSFDELARQSELDELRREVDALRTGQYMAPISKEIDHHRQEIDQHFNDLHKEFGAAPPTLEHETILPGPDAVPALPTPALDSSPVQSAPGHSSSATSSDTANEPPEWPQLSLPLSAAPLAAAPLSAASPSAAHGEAQAESITVKPGRAAPAHADPAREAAG